MKKNIIIFWITASGLSVMALLKGVPYAGIALLISSIGLGLYGAVPLFWYLFRTEEVEIEGDVIELKQIDIPGNYFTAETFCSWIKVKTNDGVQSIELSYAQYSQLCEKFKQTKGHMHVILRCVKWLLTEKITPQSIDYPI